MRSASASPSHGRLDEEAGSVPCTDSISKLLSILKKMALCVLVWCCIIVKYFMFLILAIVCLAIVVAFIVFIFCSISAIGLAIMIFLVIGLISTRISQLFRDGRGYEKLAEFKHFIHFWLYSIAALSLYGLGMFYGIAKHVPHLKEVLLLDLPLSNMVYLVIKMCGLCTLSCALYFPAHQFFGYLFMGHRHSLSTGQACSEIIDGLFFELAADEVLKVFPFVKYQEIVAGLSTQKLIKVSVLVLIGYNAIIVLTRIILVGLEAIFHRCPLTTDDKAIWPKGPERKRQLNFIWMKVSKKLGGRYLVYYANGMAVSISFIMSSMLFLLIWIFYFGKHLEINKSSKVANNVWEYGKWSFVSLFVFSFFWLIKTCVLLAWNANTVYSRLQKPIITTCEQLYFLHILKEGIALHDYIYRQHKTNLSTDNIIAEEVTDQQKSLAQAEDSDNKVRTISFLLKMIAQSGPRHQIPVSFTDILKLFTEINNGPPMTPEEKKKRLQRDLLFPENANPNLNHLEQGTRYFVSAKQDLLEETYMSEILNFFNKNAINREILAKLLDEELNPLEASNPVESNAEIKAGEDEQDSAVAKDSIEDPRGACVEAKNNEIEQENCSSSNSPPLRNPVEEANIENGQEQISVWSRFCEKFKKINQENSEGEISLVDFQTWLERANNQCVNLTNTLSSAKEVSDCLNKFISWVLIGVIFIMWLLLTGLATTKVLVLIASPLLAATFIFGNTCKTLFEGILFVYVVHPIYVGDLCSIEGKLMEVKSIGVWITTFKTIDKFGTTQELVIYSNTELVQKIITNYKTKFDWSDQVTFNLCSTEKIQDINQDYIITMIEEHLNKHKCSSFLSRTPNLTISATEDSIKLVFRLEYKTEDTDEDSTYYECLKRKHKLGGDFHLIMQKFINGFENEIMKREASLAMLLIDDLLKMHVEFDNDYEWLKECKKRMIETFPKEDQHSNTIPPEGSNTGTHQGPLQRPPSETDEVLLSSVFVRVIKVKLQKMKAEQEETKNEQGLDEESVAARSKSQKELRAIQQVEKLLKLANSLQAKVK